LPKTNDCPRCQGLMQEREDEFGARMVCMMCGRDYEVPNTRYLPYDPITDHEVPKQRQGNPWRHCPKD